MQLYLRILTYRNEPVPPAASGRFTTAGGTIGRSPDNALVLDDPGKYISRVHASIAFSAGAFMLEDLGSNPSVVNERPLGKGRSIALGHGDRLSIGDYQLMAILEEGIAAPVLPPAPVNNTALPLFEPPPPPAPVQLPPLSYAPEPAPAAATPLVMPDALAGASILDVGPGDAYAIGGNDPLGLNLFGASATPQRAAESDHVSPELAAFAMPAPLIAPVPKPAPAPAPAQSGGFSIPADYDPLADFFAPKVTAPQVVAPSGTDHLTKTFPAGLETPAPVVAPEVPAAAPEDATAFAPAWQELVQPAPSVAPVVAAPPAAPVAPVASPASTPASESAILQALLRGLGLPNLHINRPAEEVAETVGAMLREATAGTIDVLMARAVTKKESRIDVTILSVRENNPLKFFPNAEGALTQMLTGTMAGYMPPTQAMAGAFDDLRAHELAVIAGMHAALGAVLHRFDPAKIEARLAVPTVMDKMLSSNRKAKMWDRLVELYGEIAREADDDLQRLFGEKFSEAYEEQVARLRQAKRAANQ